MTTRYLKYFALVLVCAFCSCDKWLTVEPLYQITDQNLYKNTAGYYKSLNGIYYMAADFPLYGKELSWGAMEAWSRTYDLNADNFEAYSYLKDLKYENTKIRTIENMIWNNSFTAIAQTNNLIHNTLARDGAFFDNGEVERNLILGEAYALRGMLHFDLARVYAAAPITGDDASKVPYVDVYPSIVNAPIPTSQVMVKVIADLQLARELVGGYDLQTKNFSTLCGSNRFAGSGEQFYKARGIRLNYLAITALLARVNLYAGNNDKALEYAREIIGYVDAKNLKLQTAISSDPRITDEVLFGFYNERLLTTYADYSTSTSSLLVIDNGVASKLASPDKRKDILNTIGYVYKVSKKYTSTGSDLKSLIIPNLRISEMYYIACECVSATDTKEAVILLNKILKVRGVKVLPESATLEAINNTLSDEYRKEMIGEGQLLFYYKRKNLPILYSGGNFNHGGKLSMLIPNAESAI